MELVSTRADVHCTRVVRTTSHAQARTSSRRHVSNDINMVDRATLGFAPSGVVWPDADASPSAVRLAAPAVAAASASSPISSSISKMEIS